MKNIFDVNMGEIMTVGKKVKVIVDRPLGSYHPKHKNLYYPINYGYIEGIIAGDGEEQDAYILGIDYPVESFEGIVIAVVHRNDDVEDKWVVAPEGVTYSKEEITKQVKFQEKYFDSEITEVLQMKIVVLNGSPRKGGNTEIMVEAFAKGARKNNHEVIALDIATMDIKGCRGCKYCFAHLGECVQKDDMATVYKELQDADMVVFAAPIYWFDMTAQLKTVIDRLYAFGSVGFHFNKVALLLDAGADHVFDAAIAQYKGMTAYLKWEDKGIITIPNMDKKGDMANCPKLAEAFALGASL